MPPALGPGDKKVRLVLKSSTMGMYRIDIHILKHAYIQIILQAPTCTHICSLPPLYICGKGPALPLCGRHVRHQAELLLLPHTPSRRTTLSTWTPLIPIHLSPQFWTQTRYRLPLRASLPHHARLRPSTDAWTPGHLRAGWGPPRSLASVRTGGTGGRGVCAERNRAGESRDG